MKIAAYQLLTGPDVQLNLEQVILGIEKAADLGVQILAFPEGCWILLFSGLLGSDAPLDF